MRFTDGNWMIRKQYQITYAHEFYRAETEDRSVCCIAATKPIHTRGDILGSPTLQVNLTTPIPDVIGVELTHFLGAHKASPAFATADTGAAAAAQDGEDCLTVQSGSLTARVSKAPGAWELAFEAEGRRLTRSGYRGMMRAWDEEAQTSYMEDALELNVGAYVYGLGERFGPFVKNGQSVEMWNADGGTSSEQAYKNVPFFLTNQGYGVFVADAADVHFEIATERVQRTLFSVEGERLQYYVIYGKTPKEILWRYTQFTGRPALPPPWSFGLWLTTSFTTSYDETTVNGFLAGMQERDIPLSVFHFDCFWMQVLGWCDFTWDRDTFPDPEAMIRRYHDKGLKLCVWINPYIGQRSPLFAEGLQNGYFIQKQNGEPWQTDKWQPGMAIVDFTNPEASAWYCEKLERLLDMGVDCFKTDFGERIPVRDIVYHDGSDPKRMHNYYTQLYNREVFTLLERKRGKHEAVLFARSATAGGQQFPVHWGGDNSSSYLSMAETLRGGLSLALSGFGFWSHDISGFEQTAPADLYKRWCAFGLLSSHSRLHGSTSYRVPWLFDEEASDVLRYFVKLKCRLMPYLYACAVEAHQTGIPMMRPMLLEFPEDETCAWLDRQYMLGGELLVVPVFNAEGTVRFYLPEGRWTSLIDGTTAEGGRWHTQKHSFMSLPLYARENAVIVTGHTDSRPDYAYEENPVLHVYGAASDVRKTVRLFNGAGETTGVFTVWAEGDTLHARSELVKRFTAVWYAPDDGTAQVGTETGALTLRR